MKKIFASFLILCHCNIGFSQNQLPGLKYFFIIKLKSKTQVRVNEFNYLIIKTVK